MLSRPTLAVRAACATVALAAVASAHASTITDWNFASYTAAQSPDNSPAANADTTGSASIGIIGMGFDGGVAAGDIYSPGGAPGNGYTWRVRGSGGSDSNGWISTAPEYTQGIQANVSTAGATSITVSFNMAASSNGIGNAELEYSLNGGQTWILDAAVVLGTTYATQTFSIAAASNDANFEVALVSAYAPGTSAYAAPAGGTYKDGSGNWRISDFQVDGTLTPTPLPAAAWLLVSAIGGLGAFARRRRMA